MPTPVDVESSGCFNDAASSSHVFLSLPAIRVRSHPLEQGQQPKQLPASAALSLLLRAPLAHNRTASNKQEKTATSDIDSVDVAAAVAARSAALLARALALSLEQLSLSLFRSPPLLSPPTPPTHQAGLVGENAGLVAAYAGLAPPPIPPIPDPAEGLYPGLAP